MSASTGQADGPLRPRRRRWGVLIRFFVPRYDELSLFVMSLAFLSLFVADAGMRAGCRRHLAAELWDPRTYLVVAPFAAGLLFSLFNVFVTRRKSGFEKSAMLFFAVVVSAGTGIVAGVQMLEGFHGWMLVFPIWNIANGVLLLLLDRLCILDQDNIADEEATLDQVLLGALVVLAVLLVCHGVCRLHWSVTLSICVAYATNVNWAMVRFLRGPGRAA
ncbi:MAG TPA: hypothetical protein PK280_07445 [Planctomycetota bacterium]|nr:hypothetical protein [Planctomycetota bacterium]